MSVQENIAIAHDYLDRVWNEHDLDAVDDYLAPDYVNHDPLESQFPPGREGAKIFASTIFSAFPDVRATFNDEQADGDLVRIRFTCQGTHQGELMGMPATGRRAQVPVTLTLRVEDGMITEGWGEWDPNDMLRQLGLG